MTTTTAKAPQIKLKSLVRWNSSANGTMSEKKGEVVAIVQPGQDPLSKVNRTMEKECILRFDGIVRDHRSYLVRVSRGEGKKPYIYFPRVNGLEII